MVNVRLFGLFRLDSGIKELNAEAGSVKELYSVLLEECRKANPNTKITMKDLNGCVIFVNDVQAKKSAKLKDGDRVMLMSPVCGG